MTVATASPKADPREFGAKFGELKTLLAKPDPTSEELERAEALTVECEAIKARIDSASAIKTRAATLEALNDTLNRPVGRPVVGGDGTGTNARGEPHEIKSLGWQLAEHPTLRGHKRGGRINAEFDLEGLIDPSIKTTFTTSGLTSYQRPPGIVQVLQQQLYVAELFAQGTTSSPVIRYMQETSFTNAATAVAEGTLKPEAAFALAEVDSPVRKIAVTAKVSDEMLADFEGMQSYLDGRLRFMVMQREEALILNGNGTAPNLRGILQTSGIQTESVGADTNADAIFKAITKVRSVAFLEPDAILINPLDWQKLKLAKDANQQYYGGGPFSAPYGNGPYTNLASMWGLPVVVTTSIATGTALVGAFKLSAQLFRRQGVGVEMTNSNVDDFNYNLVSMRCESRLALVVYRPQGFCTVTGIA